MTVSGARDEGGHCRMALGFANLRISEHFFENPYHNSQICVIMLPINLKEAA